MLLPQMGGKEVECVSGILALQTAVKDWYLPHLILGADGKLAYFECLMADKTVGRFCCRSENLQC